MDVTVRSVSIFLVNERTPPADRARDEAFAFQAELEVRSAVPFVPRPDPRGVSGDDPDERVAYLHFADTPEYAAGHGVAADWELIDGACRLLRTTWIPSAEVEKTETVEVSGVELSMAALGDLFDGADAQRALTPLVTGYREWIDRQRAALTDLTGGRRDTAEELVFHPRSAPNRIERGIRVLAQDADALDGCRVANRAVAAALSRRLAREGATEPPRWRAFHLAFLLRNLPGIADPSNPERNMDILFFPTGGGKTEAYLGLAAFTTVLRLRNPDDGGRAGAGVSVIMRYTLRLLTLDQLGRAAGLVCALGPSREDSFFARTLPASQRNAREYVGIASQGRNPKEAMRRVLHAAGGPRDQDNPADPYAAMHRAVLDVYGWTDIPTDPDFIRDYEIVEAAWGRKKKPYRCRWPDPVRDEVLACLLALNADRAAEEDRAGSTLRALKQRPEPAPLRRPERRPANMVAEPAAGDATSDD